MFMAEKLDEGTFESRLANMLDSIDEGSKKLEHWVNKKRKKKIIEGDLDKNIDIDEETESLSDTGTEDVDEDEKIEILTETAPESSYQSSKHQDIVDCIVKAGVRSELFFIDQAKREKAAAGAASSGADGVTSSPANISAEGNPGFVKQKLKYVGRGAAAARSPDTDRDMPPAARPSSCTDDDERN